MRWWLVSAAVAAALTEGLILVNWPLLDAKAPVTWLAVLFITSEEWVGWRQGLVIAAVAGYVLDVVAAPAPGSVLVPMLLAWGLSAYLLMKYKYSRNFKIVTLAMGTLVYLAGSLAVGPYFPVWTDATRMVLVYLSISTASYVILSSSVKFWLRKV